MYNMSADFVQYMCPGWGRQMVMWLIQKFQPGSIFCSLDYIHNEINPKEMTQLSVCVTKYQTTKTHRGVKAELHPTVTFAKD